MSDRTLSPSTPSDDEPTLGLRPAMARTDVEPSALPTPSAPASTGRVRAAGAGVALGAAGYGVTVLVHGSHGFVVDLVGTFFQLGLFGLLTVMVTTAATGTGRGARALLKVELGLLTVATVQSLLTLPAGGGQWSTAAQVLDPFWPLSMLGMAVVGVKVAVAGRWRGVLRGWPAVAESWILVVLPVGIVLGDGAADIVGGAHFVLGYGVLGLLLLARPTLTGPRA